MPASSGPVQLLLFPGLGLPVILREAPDVLAGLRRAVPSWTPHIRTAPSARLPSLCSVSREADGFTLRSIFLEEPITGLAAAGAVCGIVADLAQGYFEERSGFSGLHCGAFRFGGRLIAVTGPAHAGKSTLIARLSAENDMQILCDDVLPITADGMAHGLGIAPRLRLPLPEGTHEQFSGHVARHIALSDGHHAFIAPPTLAAHGTSQPLEVLLVLSRENGAAASLQRLGAAECLHHVLRQSIYAAASEAAIERANLLSERLACFKLTYWDIEDAVSLIRATLSHASLPEEGQPGCKPPAGHSATTAPLPQADLRLGWKRQENVTLRRMAGGLVLWHGEHGTAFHLNPTASAIWTLLAEVNSGEEIIAAFAEAFPDQPAERIRIDLGQLFAQMAEEDLIAVT
ncbi:PqqD family protein [Aestuariivirga sp.]|uniref:PqqD family protein n=1 Tax=Aestuariivirga sp. TaxID=2650926 RepID=UPI0035933C08